MTPARAAAGGDSAPIQWFAPDEVLDGELVLSGELAGLVNTLARELRHASRFLECGVDPATRILFSGPSGTGKTLAARWLGWKLKVPVAVVDVGAVVGSYVGQTSGNVAACFKSFGAVPKAILFLDEVDAICLRRDRAKTSAGAELARATTTFFQQVDWLPPDRIVIAATNFPDDLDPALRRRLGVEVAFTLPDRAARRQMLEQWLSRAPLAPEQLDAIADGSEGLSGAQLRSRAMAAARRAIMAMPEALPPRPGKLPDAVTRENVERAQGILRLLEGTGS